MSSEGDMQHVCQDVVDTVAGATGCSVFDGTGRCLASAHTKDSADDEPVSMGQQLGRFLLGGADARGTAHEDAPETQKTICELHISAPQRLYFIRACRRRHYVLILATEPSTKVGMAWAMVRGAASNVDEHLTTGD